MLLKTCKLQRSVATPAVTRFPFRFLRCIFEKVNKTLLQSWWFKKGASLYGTYVKNSPNCWIYRTELWVSTGTVPQYYITLTLISVELFISYIYYSVLFNLFGTRKRRLSAILFWFFKLQFIKIWMNPELPAESKNKIVLFEFFYIAIINVRMYITCMKLNIYFHIWNVKIIHTCHY